MSALPWTILARRTAFHSELQTSPAEAVLGDMPRLPGDLDPAMPNDHSFADLLDRVRANAKKPPAQTTLRRDLPTYFPDTAVNATHIYRRRGKVEL